MSAAPKVRAALPADAFAWLSTSTSVAHAVIPGRMPRREAIAIARRAGLVRVGPGLPMRIGMCGRLVEGGEEHPKRRRCADCLRNLADGEGMFVAVAGAAVAGVVGAAIAAMRGASS